MKISNIKTRFIIVFLLLQTFDLWAQKSLENGQLKKMKEIIAQTVLLNNEGNVIPIQSIYNKNIASISFDVDHHFVLDSLLNKYAKVTSIVHRKNNTEIEKQLANFNTILISININQQSNINLVKWIHQWSQNKQIVIVLFGQAKNILPYQEIKAPILWTPTLSALSASVVPQIIFGGIAAQSVLEKDISTKYKAGFGLQTQATRLKYTIPEELNIQSKNLKEIDDLAFEAIHQKAAPGMVVLAAKNGKVFFNKAYGFHTYEKTRADRVTDIFDLASVTKITATTPAVMRLVEQKKLNLDSTVSFYLPKLKNTPLSDIRIREVMLHQAGFIPYIPFQNHLLDNDYCQDSLENYCTKVADGYFVRDNYFYDTMLPKMLNTPLKTRGKYVYSDISMYLMKEVVEQITSTPLNVYVEENFYKSLGMQKTGYLPREKFDKQIIVPTEEDKIFRKTTLQGYVHDQGAALSGGIAGHAGLFSTANDLAIFYQMLLNKGSYGGDKIFDAQTVALFTQKQSEVSRRGLGFDRWDADTTKKYPSELSSPQTFGHTGYTGTAVWVDEQRDLVFVFLSNRVYPKVSDKIINLATRRKMLDVFNKAIDKANNQN